MEKTTGTGKDMTVRTLIRFTLAAGLLAGLPACGLQGDLARPDPLFGDPEARDEAELPLRSVDSGLEDDDTLGGFEETGENAEDESEPNAEDELLGGPGG